MKKRLLALALCVVLLPACVLAAAGSSPTDVRDDSVIRQLNAVVFCLNSTRYRLVPDVRPVSIMSSETMLEVLAQEVLAIPQSTQLLSAVYGWADLYLLSVLQSGRIATVDLGGDVSLMQPYEVFCVKAAMVNTLIESGQVDYVNVLFNGREVTTNDLPTGTMTKFSEDLQSEWIQHENEGVAALRSGDYSFKRYVTLYFASKDSNLLLAEVRQLTFTRSNLATPVVEAVISGPTSSSDLRRSFPASVRLIDIPFFEENSDETNLLDINFTIEFSRALSDNSTQRMLQMGPLVMTLTTFLPETIMVRVRVNRRPIEDSTSSQDADDRLFYRDRFVGLLGRTVELYYPKSDGRLYRVTRAVPQKENTLRDLIEQLLVLPQVDVQQVFPEEFTSDHLQGVVLMDDMAVVNLTQEGAELMSAYSQDQERASIFAIVNTLTGYPGVNRVQFLVQGYKVDGFAGYVDLRSPLLRNPGIIQTTLD